jgi:Zn-dependent protease with chaperone function
MSPHPLLFKRFIRFQMITVVSLVVLGAIYALALWINSSLLLQVLEPAITIVANVVFYGLFLVPFVWITARFIFVNVFSRRVTVELKERLQRLAVETLRRMSINPGSTRFTVGKGSSSAHVRRWPHRDTIVVGEQLMQDASDEEIMAILGHELGHIVKRHLTIRGAVNALYFFAFLGVSYEAGRSHTAAVLSVAGFLALVLAGNPLNWRMEYAADKFSAERLGPNSMLSALEKLKVYYPDCISFTHPPLSRRIRRIQALSITPLITHVYA